MAPVQLAALFKQHRAVLLNIEDIMACPSTKEQIVPFSGSS
jgi:hypothetical protein